LKATAILPVKRLAAAKQRLGLDGERRRTLVTAMLEDVLEAIGEARQVERTLVVTRERAAERIAAAAGAEVIADPADESHPEAALIGIRRALDLGAESVVLLPGDCPLLDPRELDSLLSATGERHVAVVPDRHGTGTNALVLSPPDAIRPAFGEGSRDRHVAAARAAGIPFFVEEVESLALDLDTPADMIALTRELDSGRGRAPRTAKALGI
jgi:2-phospho-L-lactate/phosphoenolpyruvate guanylyltransferase